ncbi:hypothetical protein B0H10DRAFT_1395958 [Mycena sp. CBHHK59/15]|nr:hypothetical protein B0H10DRAFT_1395958 [Mycena sp. CBHHK59/15]
MATYSVSDYLLDRVNIQDTITAMTWHVDRKNWDDLSSVFTDKLVMDYTSILGGGPVDTTAVDQAQTWKSMLEYIDSTQHVVAGILIKLPQPISDTPVGIPAVAECSCNCSVTLMRSAAHGDPIQQSGGHYKFKLLRGAPSPSGNPWRISYMKADLAFMKGNADVAMNPKTSIGWL